MPKILHMMEDSIADISLESLLESSQQRRTTHGEPKQSACSFLDRLPREIRDQIYSHVLVSDKGIAHIPPCDMQGTDIRPVGDALDVVKWFSSTRTLIDTSLLRVNKAVYEEASEILFRENIVTLDLYRILLVSGTTQVDLRALREAHRINVVFLKHYEQYYARNWNQRYKNYAHYLVTQLRGRESLKELRIFILLDQGLRLWYSNYLGEVESFVQSFPAFDSVPRISFYAQRYLSHYSMSEAIPEDDSTREVTAQMSLEELQDELELL
jgi:hypothetical protein